MAQRMVVTMSDDMTGKTGDDVATVAFTAPDGREYEIDLDGKNRAELAAVQEQMAQLMRPFVEHARRATPKVNGRGHSAGKAPTGDPARSQKIRDWAKVNGVAVSARGRISKGVIDAYDKALLTTVTREGAGGADKVTTKAPAPKAAAKAPEKVVKAPQAPQGEGTETKPAPRKRVAKKAATAAPVAAEGK